MSFDEGTGSAQRIDTIRSLHIMDSEDEADFDEIATYASEICAAPISLVTLVTGTGNGRRRRMAPTSATIRWTNPSARMP